MADEAQTVLEEAATRWRSASPGSPAEPWRVGVDLGTASCVVVVLDGEDRPIWVDSEGSGALADGVVVDFAVATRTVAALRRRAMEALGRELTQAATAYPPNIGEADSRACRYVCEAAGFDEVVLVDEVTAARTMLEVHDGVVVDVGGGSTGVGVFRGGRLVAIDDRPGGGHHLDLILAGALGLCVARAEEVKRRDPEACLPLLRPGIERIAESVRAMTFDAEELDVHLAGGALMVTGADDVVAKYLGRPVVSYPHALLITPVGIARNAP